MIPAAEVGLMETSLLLLLLIILLLLLLLLWPPPPPPLDRPPVLKEREKETHANINKDERFRSEVWVRIIDSWSDGTYLLLLGVS